MHSLALRHIPAGLTALRAALGPVVATFAVLKPMPVAFALCLGLAISVTLRQWRTDVPTLFHALKF
jgi:hypothetical protein